MVITSERTPTALGCPCRTPQLRATSGLSASPRFPVWDVSCKCNHVPASLIGTFSRPVQVTTCIGASFHVMMSFYMVTPHFVHPFTSGWAFAFSHFGLLRMILLRDPSTRVCVHALPFLSVHGGAELLGQRVALTGNCLGTPGLFSGRPCRFPCPSVGARVPASRRPH